jgi:hypothetical protein
MVLLRFATVVALPLQWLCRNWTEWTKCSYTISDVYICMFSMNIYDFKRPSRTSLISSAPHPIRIPHSSKRLSGNRTGCEVGSRRHD